MKITLTSPSGTTSVLSPGGRSEYTQLGDGEWWEFLTLRSWGETPYGNWKLSITDTKSGNGNGNGDESSMMCIDRPFSVPPTVTTFDIPLTCAEYKSKEYCGNGEINSDVVSQLIQPADIYAVLFETEYGESSVTAEEACCSCGGGINENDDFFTGQLKEWKIVLGDGTPTIGTKRISKDYDPLLPLVTDYEFIRCRGETIYGEKRDCCNGLESICDLRVDEVLFATLHNGLNDFEDGNYLLIHKQFEPERALEAGYRAFKLNICNCDGVIRICFGKYET